MPGYGEMQRVPARQKPADNGAAERRPGAQIAVRDAATTGHGVLANALNESPRTQSLLQMRQAFDEGPRVQSQLALQRALNRTRAPEANEGVDPEQDARSEPAQLAAMPGEADPLPAPVQRKPNATGLPDHLKAGVENLSGLAMDDVRVHYNSSKPAAVQAHAYAQGTDIHVAPGQEKHLPHEAWHVVQQKQGRVKPTLQMKSKIAINDDPSLEQEADDMGARALQAKSTGTIGNRQSSANSRVVQRAIGFEFETGNRVFQKNFSPGTKNVAFLTGAGWKAVPDQLSVEFVTDPVDETEQGLKLTQGILKSLTKFASTMETVLKEVGFQNTNEGGFWENLFADTHDEKETSFGEVKFKNAAGEDKTTGSLPLATVGYLAKKGQANAVSPDFWIMQSDTKKVEAAPQVTGGIRLEKIPAAVGAIAKDPGMRRIGDVNKDVETQELLTSVTLAHQASKTEKKPLNDRFIGFLSLLIAYLRVPVALADIQKKPADYPKDMPLLSRTNFGTLALAAAGRNEGLKMDAKEQLPKEGPKEQEPKKDEPKKEEPKKEPTDFKAELPKKGTPKKESHVESSAEWDFLQNPEKLWAAAGLKGSIQGSMFPKGYITTGGEVNQGPTREEFLVGLAQGKDVFAGSKDAGQAAMGSMGMGAVAANPKAGEAQDRAILEFRRLPAPVEVSKWSDVAISLFKKICGINR